MDVQDVEEQYDLGRGDFRKQNIRERALKAFFDLEGQFVIFVYRSDFATVQRYFNPLIGNRTEVLKSPQQKGVSV